MKLVLYFLAFLLCFGIDTSNADSGRSVEGKRKFISISNEANEDAFMQCSSGEEILNKTLKSGEKIRWFSPEDEAMSTICRVGFGRGKGVHGYFTPFLEKYCEKECRWRVLDGGVLKLKLNGGRWKRFKLMFDDEDDGGHVAGDGAPATRIDETALPPVDDGWPEWENGNSWEWDSPAAGPANREMKSRAKSAPFPTRQIRKIAPAQPPDNAKFGQPPTQRNHGKSKRGDSPAKRGRKKLGARKKAPSQGKGIAPPPENAKAAPSPTKHGWSKLKPRNPHRWKSPAPLKAAAARPAKRGRWKLKPRKPRKLRSPVPEKAAVPTPAKKIKKSPAPFPTKHAKTAPPPMKHDHGDSQQWKPPASPAESVELALPPRKLKPVTAPPPEIEESEPRTKLAPPPMKHDHGNSPRRGSPAPPPENWKHGTPGVELAPTPPELKPVTAPPPRTKHAPSPARLTTPPPPIGGEEESEGPEADGELARPLRRRSTFYSCIKED